AAVRDVRRELVAQVDAERGVPVVADLGTDTALGAELVDPLAAADEDQRRAEQDEQGEDRVPAPRRRAPSRPATAGAGRPGHLLAGRRLTHGARTLPAPTPLGGAVAARHTQPNGQRGADDRQEQA